MPSKARQLRTGRLWGKGRAAGFSLLETVVALAIFAAGAMTLYGLFNTNLIALERVQATAEQLPVARNAIEILSTVNPWRQAEGQFEIDGYQVVWTARPIAPVRHGQTIAGMMADFDFGLYEIEFAVADGSRQLGSWRMRSVGYERVRGAGAGSGGFLMPRLFHGGSGQMPGNRAGAIGLTLIEMLVVFVLLGLVSTLLFQATGFFANRYETVQRLHREGSVTGLQQHWFITAVQALVPYGREARRFRGHDTAFEGLTLQPLAAEPGMPVGTRWTIDERDGIQAVVYREERGPRAGDIEWSLYSTAEPGLRFQYADAQGQWRTRWPVEDAPNDWLPQAIRLLTPANGTLWVARIDPTAIPVLTEEDLL